MDPALSLPDCALSRPGTITADFLAAGVTDYREAARYVRDLETGRTKRAGGLSRRAH